jgi:mRNA-decapping enzyme 1B
MSGITEQARKEANLRLLQRTCLREINDVVQTATHVVLYEFICDGWQKCNIEGSMFLTQTPERYYLVILNRHSTENLIMEVAGTMQLQHQDPYLIFRERVGDATRIRGIWFHNADERSAMTTVLQRSIERLQAGSVPPPPPPTPTTPAPAARPPPSTPSPRAPQLSTPAPRSHSLSSSSPEPSSASNSTALEPLLASMAVSALAANATPTPSRGASSSSPSPSSPGGGGTGVALDKKSLQLALLSLIQDDRFLDLLHSQYLRVVHARVKKQQQHQPPPNEDDSGTNS